MLRFSLMFLLGIAQGRRPVLAGLMVLVLPGVAAAAVEIRGVPRIIDGDTVEIGVARLRLSGADAPELDQSCQDTDGKPWACGRKAREALIDRFGDNKTWICKAGSRNRYGQRLATCTVDGVDVAHTMVSEGWALAYARFSRAYEEDEVQARREQAGVWGGSFVYPWDWRTRNRMARIRGQTKSGSDSMAVLMGRPGQAVPPSACRIKANTTRAGVCTYFLPGTRRYRFVNMKVGAGKRWFCSEPEAQAAGCRPATP